MKTIIKLVVMLIVLNAVFRSGQAALSYYRLKDASQQLLQFGGQLPTAQLQNDILRKAWELDIPLDAERVTVERQGPRTLADATYTQPVEIFPGVTYPVRFSFSVEAYALVSGPATADPAR